MVSGEPLERQEEPFAIAVRNIDEPLECLRLLEGLKCRGRVRLEYLDAKKTEGPSGDAPVHTKGGEYST